ncbi:hypothetical protein [Amantichitinum ursilacus]|uniref:hypothetical protein n=1 Tax=Amantichitinum ursilacus TaxID=857265 RepID=UPI00128FBA40|nr:hypothetical protein [Amantichitinum ursilacus]
MDKQTILIITIILMAVGFLLRALLLHSLKRTFPNSYSRLGKPSVMESKGSPGAHAFNKFLWEFGFLKLMEFDVIAHSFLRIDITIFCSLPYGEGVAGMEAHVLRISGAHWPGGLLGEASSLSTAMVGGSPSVNATTGNTWKW